MCAILTERRVLGAGMRSCSENVQGYSRIPVLIDRKPFLLCLSWKSVGCATLSTLRGCKRVGLDGGVKFVPLYVSLQKVSIIFIIVVLH